MRGIAVARCDLLFEHRLGADGVGSGWNQPDPAGYPVNVRVNGNHVPFEIEEQDAGGGLLPNPLYAGQECHRFVVGHVVEECGVERTAMLDNRRQCALDRWSFLTGEAARSNSCFDFVYSGGQHGVPGGELVS